MKCRYCFDTGVWHKNQNPETATGIFNTTNISSLINDYAIIYCDCDKGIELHSLHQIRDIIKNNAQKYSRKDLFKKEEQAIVKKHQEELDKLHKQFSKNTFIPPQDYMQELTEKSLIEEIRRNREKE